MFASPCRRVRGQKSGGTNVSTVTMRDADFAVPLQGSNQLLDGDVALASGQGVSVTGTAAKGVNIGFYTADDDKPLVVKWSKSSGKLSASSFMGKKWGTSLKTNEAPLVIGDTFTVTVTAAVDTVTIDAVNNSTGKAAQLEWAVKVDTIRYVRSYGDGKLEPLNPKLNAMSYPSWLRTPGICVDAGGEDIDVNALTTTRPDAYQCLEWCETQHGTTACEWNQTKSRCTAHKSTKVVRGRRDSKSTLCYVPPPKCSCNVDSVQEKAWVQLD